MKAFFIFVSLIVLGMISIPSTSFAQDIYDWSEPELPVLITTKGALIFIGKEKMPIRVYSWKASKGKNKKSSFIVDMDGDGKPDVVGAGKPIFVLNHMSDPVAYNKKGCNQVLVADFVADEKLDIACVNGKGITVYTHDLQMAWTAKINKNIKFCRAGDVNGDLKAELECRHGKSWARFDGSNGELIAGETKTEEVTHPISVGIDPADPDILNGKRAFDFDGDGTSEETLVVDGNAVAIRSHSKKVGLARFTLKSAPITALVKDIDGDKKVEIIIVTKKEILIASPDGKHTKSYSLNPKKYKRTPLAKLDSVYGNGFSDDKAAQKVVTEMNKKFSSCYSGQVRKNQFAGGGKMLVEAKVNKKGKVKSVTIHHSSLADKKVGKCVRGILKKLKFPAAAEDSATMNVSLSFTFRDQ